MYIQYKNICRVMLIVKVNERWCKLNDDMPVRENWKLVSFRNRGNKTITTTQNDSNARHGKPVRQRMRSDDYITRFLLLFFCAYFLMVALCSLTVGNEDPRSRCVGLEVQCNKCTDAGCNSIPQWSQRLVLWSTQFMVKIQSLF